MKSKEYINLERDIFNLAIFILSSAKILKNEPPTYGTSRLITVFNKLVDLSRFFKENEERSFWSEIRNIKKNKDIDKFLDDVLSKFLDESMKRGNIRPSAQ